MQTQTHTCPTSDTIYHCPDCTWTGKLDVPARITATHERVAFRGPMAAGKCPVCETLISVDDQDVPDYTLQSVAQIMLQRGWIVTLPATASITSTPSAVSALKARIEAKVTTLRSVAAEPVAIRYGDQVSIELRPTADDDRVRALHDRLGFAVSNYAPDGIAVDVADNLGDIVQSVIVALYDLDRLRGD